MKKPNMILKKIYDEKTKTQRVWYDSTMIAYTEMVEDEYENKGNLYVTFKNGSTYIYKDVLIEDYILFIGGGTDASQGKTLNKVIKTKYEFEKGETKNVQELFDEMNRINEQEMSQDVNITHTYRIMGEDDLTDNELEYNYYPKIDLALFSTNEDVKFIIGDGLGFDKRIQDYLMDFLHIKPELIEVYYIGDEPLYVNPKITNKKGGFEDRESMNNHAMWNSSKDIAFVRSTDEVTETSRNILRRHLLTTL